MTSRSKEHENNRRCPHCGGCVDHLCRETITEPGVLQETVRMEWLEQNEQRLTDVYWRMQNEAETVREAIDALMVLQAPETPPT